MTGFVSTHQAANLVLLLPIERYEEFRFEPGIWKTAELGKPLSSD